MASDMHHPGSTAAAGVGSHGKHHSLTHAAAVLLEMRRAAAVMTCALPTWYHSSIKSTSHAPVAAICALIRSGRERAVAVARGIAACVVCGCMAGGMG